MRGIPGGRLSASSRRTSESRRGQTVDLFWTHAPLACTLDTVHDGAHEQRDHRRVQIESAGKPVRRQQGDHGQSTGIAAEMAAIQLYPHGTGRSRLLHRPLCHLGVRCAKVVGMELVLARAEVKALEWSAKLGQERRPADVMLPSSRE